MKHKEWYTPGYGTEKVGPFLIGLMEMARPQKVLEIGFGYTTPFLMEGLKNNFELHWDGNCDPEFMKTEYDPRLVVIDDQSLETDERCYNYTCDHTDRLFVRFLLLHYLHHNIRNKRNKSYY